MVRPLKLKSETKSYNFCIPVDQYDRLSEHAKRMQRRKFEQVSVADLIRTAVGIYLEVLDEDFIDEKKGE